MGDTNTLPARAKASDATQDHDQLHPLPFGKVLQSEFLFDPSYRNLNHGSFGATPRYVHSRLQHYQLLAEAQPDVFIRYTQNVHLDASRAALAALLHAPLETIVFTANATTGVNTVLRALQWAADGRDEILSFSSIYGGCGKSIDYVVASSYGRVGQRTVPLDYPLEDDAVVSRFRAAVRESRAEGRNPKIAVLDTVSSNPGVRFPFEQVVAACRAEGILSLVDGAQGVGLIALDLGALDPDFFVSNCHKWLFAPRASAVFYVPVRNQHLVPSTLPTSHGYVPPQTAGGDKRFNPLPPNGKSVFVNNFQFLGSNDVAPYLCAKDALEWRERVLGGEERIRTWQTDLARRGGKRVAEILGTEVLDNESHTLTDCGMVNVALPLGIEGEVARKENLALLPSSETAAVKMWIERTLIDEFRTFLVLFVYRGRWWARISAQVYLDDEDFEWAGQTLKEICERVKKGQHRGVAA